jgi:hypothetical protein
LAEAGRAIAIRSTIEATTGEVTKARRFTNLGKPTEESAKATQGLRQGRRWLAISQ